jgi:predicted DNA-binding transcriptional regulator AlpA
MHPHEYNQAKHAVIAPLSVGDDDTLLTSRQVRAKVGSISDMTLWRWLGSDDVRFPQPTLRVNKRRYWSAGAIRRWLAERSSEGLAA